MKLIPLKSGDEYDGLPKRAKRWYHWNAGVRRYIKKQYNKRVRRKAKQELYNSIKSSLRDSCE